MGGAGMPPLQVAGSMPGMMVRLRVRVRVS
jgi:hypothetical protein